MKFYDDPIAQLTRWSSLHRFLASKPLDPMPLALAEYEATGAREREIFDENRRAYVSGGMVIGTPEIKELIETTRVVMEQNHHSPAGRRGILLDGASATGKTTSCLALMRTAYLAYEAQYPDLIDGGAVPVVYVEVPPGATAKGMMQRFTDFYAIPYTNSTTLNTLKHLVVQAMRDTKTQIVIVDEVQNLGRISGSSGYSVDTLKDLSNDSPATFVYSGIDLESSGLLAGPRGDQVGRRFTPIRLTLTKNGPRWRGTVRAFGKMLPLFATDPEDLVEMSTDLHKLTEGNIGTLQNILAQATHLLIDTQNPREEKITLDILKGTKRDLRAISGTTSPSSRRIGGNAA